jgi:hypothetical protein
MKLKLKGTVLVETLQKILHRANDSGLRDDGSIWYWTGKNSFIAKRKSVRYWDIFIVQGTI